MSRYSGYSNYKTPLPCFTPDYYYWTTSDNDRQCIAPTAKFKRCSFDITTQVLEEIKSLTISAREAGPGEGQTAILKRIILLQLCGDHHRRKVEQDSGCLAQLVERYRFQILAKFARSTPRVTRFATPSLSPSPSTVSSPARTDYSGRIRRDYQLRPRDGSGGTLQLERDDIFVKYDPDPNDNMRDIFASSVPYGVKSSGWVYAFSWPSNPDYIKIGYSAVSVEDRYKDWRECHPGLKILHTVQVPFPKRVEKLIHMQMAAQRYEIIICKTCASTHHEWFKVSQADVMKIMNDWEKITVTHQLYSADRMLSGLWARRAAEIVGDITASALLSRLAMEDLRARIAEPVTVLVRTPEPEGSRVRADSVVAVDAESALKLSTAARTDEKTGPRVTITAVIEEEPVSTDVVAEVKKPDNDCVTSVEEAGLSWESMLEGFGDFMRMVAGQMVCT